MNHGQTVYLIERFGFVLSGNRAFYLHNSQPPFLSMMIRDVYDVTKKKDWLVKVYHAVKKEHFFWSEKRGSAIGLNRYDWIPMKREDWGGAAECLRNRIGYVDCGIYCNQSHAPFPSTPKRDWLKRAIECTAEAGGNIYVIHPDNDKTAKKCRDARDEYQCR